MAEPDTFHPVQAEIPDWVLALKPPEADTAATEAQFPSGDVFIGLDTELQELAQDNPEELAWLAEIAEQTAEPLSQEEAAASLEGTHKPAPPPRRRRRKSGLRKSQLVVLGIMMVFMILALLGVFLALRYLVPFP